MGCGNPYFDLGWAHPVVQRRGPMEPPPKPADLTPDAYVIPSSLDELARDIRELEAIAPEKAKVLKTVLEVLKLDDMRGRPRSVLEVNLGG